MNMLVLRLATKQWGLNSTTCSGWATPVVTCSKGGQIQIRSSDQKQYSMLLSIIFVV